jgi:transcription antitermination factor NusG
MQNDSKGDFAEIRPTSLAWFAVYTRHQHEGKVALRLAERDFEIFYPTYTELRRWKDRRKEITLPLFPGYVFFRGLLNSHLPILVTPGVQFIVSTGRSPAAIPEEQLEGLRRASHHRLSLEPFPFLNAGDRVRVTRGPLAGTEGWLARKKDALRLVLSIDILGRSAGVEIDASDVRPCETLKMPREAFALAHSESSRHGSDTHSIQYG